MRNVQAKISPEPMALPEPRVGVHSSFEKSMQLTANRILEGIPPSKIPNPAVMNIKYGFDGSGSHAIYRQLKNKKTNNIIMFCPLNISSEQCIDTVLWLCRWARSRQSPYNHLRTIRLKLARKTSQSANLDDTIRRLWLGSDPKANNVHLKAQPYCKHCAEHGHSSRYCRIKNPIFGPLSDDDALFESVVISHN